jgi:hypothetical protein
LILLNNFAAIKLQINSFKKMVLQQKVGKCSKIIPLSLTILVVLLPIIGTVQGDAKSCVNYCNNEYLVCAKAGKI